MAMAKHLSTAIQVAKHCEKYPMRRLVNTLKWQYNVISMAPLAEKPMMEMIKLVAIAERSVHARLRSNVKGIDPSDLRDERITTAQIFPAKPNP
jgi:hypothetical protein